MSSPPGLRSALDIGNQSRDEGISEDEPQTQPDLMSQNPALPGFPGHLPALHHRPETGHAARRSSSQRRRLGGAFRNRGIRIRRDLTRGHIDPVVLHPLPVVGVQVGPLGPELQAPISGFDVVDALRRSMDARRKAGMRPSTGRVPPS